MSEVQSRTVPAPSEVSQPFWDATTERRLVIQRCDACDTFVWYPRGFCPGCLDEQLDWVEVSGRATVYAVSVHHRAPSPELKDRAPYALALVDLDEGVRLMTNVVGVDPAEVAVGQRVRATWEPLDDGRNLLVFEPEPAGS